MSAHSACASCRDGRGARLRAGTGVLLLFEREALAERDGPIAAHGSRGPGHACLLAPGEAYESGATRLEATGIEITHDHEWDGGHGGRSTSTIRPAT